MATKTIEMFERTTDRDYPYVVIYGVKTAPPIAVGMVAGLSYVEKTVDEALEFVAKIHPDVDVKCVFNYVEA
jgi:hypothetical protein